MYLVYKYILYLYTNVLIYLVYKLIYIYIIFSTDKVRLTSGSQVVPVWEALLLISLLLKFSPKSVIGSDFHMFCH
jgi:hypothetical protein